MPSSPLSPWTPLVAIHFLSAASLAASPPAMAPSGSLASPPRGVALAGEPLILGMDGRMSQSLLAAHALAAESLSRDRECEALFSRLEADGLALLYRTRYRRATAREESRFCRRGAVALTNVGHPVTAVCRSFARLPEARGAAVLLHEALHLGGMPESPVVAGAPTSAEINQLVERSCAL